MTQFVVSIQNLAPSQGTLLTPLWFGFHDGNFDLFNSGASASPGLESLAEDGSTGLISQEFTNAGFGNVQGTILGLAGANPGPIDIGEVATFVIEVDETDASNRYFSYASMVIPSNDTFIGNGNPLAFRIFDDAGNFLGADFVVTTVWDAGTEVNDEIPSNTAFFGQTTPNTGVDQNGTVALATGFNPVGSGGILDSPSFVNADYTVANYQVARISIVPLFSPENSTLITGTNGSDEILAGVTPGFDGNSDIVFTGAGNDEVDVPIGGALTGFNRINSGSGADTLFASNGDRLFGGAGNDELDATDATGTRLSGGAGDDIFFLGTNGRALGGDGDDQFYVQAGGGNILAGGAGADQFWMLTDAIPSTANTIADFVSGVDVIGIANQGAGVDFSDLSLSGNTIALNGQTFATLTGVQTNTLTAANFVFI